MDKVLEKQLLKWLKAQKSACGSALKVAIVCGCLTGVVLVAQAYLLATILQGVVMQDLSITAFDSQLYLLMVLVGLRALLAYLRERFSFKAGLLLRQSMREAVMQKLSALGPIFIQGKPAGAWATLVLEQIEELQDFYGRYLPQMSVAMFIPLIILCVVFPQNWAAGAVLLLSAPLIPLFMILVGWGAADANRRHFQALSRLSGLFLDRLQGLSTLRLFHQQQHQLQIIEKRSEDFRSRTMSVLRMAFLSSAVLEFFAALSIAVLAVYFGFSYLGHLNFGHYGEAMTGADLSLYIGMFVLILAPEFYQPLRDLGSHYHAKAQAIAAAENLRTLLETPEVVQQGTQQPQAPFVIKAEQLKVYSHDQTLLLDGLEFEFHSQQKIGFVGQSGAGKTTLFNALLGFLPIEGRLTINGIDFAEIDKIYWRQQLSWLGQTPQLFHGSIKHNINLAHTLTDEGLQQVIQQAHLNEVILNKKGGLNFVINEQGQGLSVGQAQRVALARALAKPAQLLFLDEPTASLDQQSAELVSLGIKQALTQGQLGCCFITHDLSKLKDMDSILLFAQGQLIAQGSLAELQALPQFQQLQQAQE